MPLIVNMDGQLIAPGEAKVSIFDRGFLYGDSVYEVIRTYRRRPFTLEAHTARLERSAARVMLHLPWSAARLAGEIARTLEAYVPDVPVDPEVAPWNVGECSVRAIMTRGAGALGLDPDLAVEPLALVIVSPLHAPVLSAYRRGVACRIVGVRHDAPDSTDGTAKTGARITHVLAVGEARRAGAFEALLLDQRGYLTEGASSNVFVVKGGRLLTPPLAAGILEGVTRGIVMTLARGAGLVVCEQPLPAGELGELDEMFITSTPWEVLPVTVLDGRPVGSGRVGEVTTYLHDLFREQAEREAGAR